MTLLLIACGIIAAYLLPQLLQMILYSPKSGAGLKEYVFYDPVSDNMFIANLDWHEVPEDYYYIGEL